MIRNICYALGATLALLLAAICPQTADAKKGTSYSLFGDRNKLVGSGNLITKQIAKPAFSEIEASRAVKVILTTAASDVIEIKADDNVMPYVVITCKEQKLRVTIDKAIHSISDITVEVTVPVDHTLSELAASSAAKIVSTDALTLNELDIDTSSAAKIDLSNIEAAKVELEASSASKIRIAKLTARKAEMQTSSAAKIEADVAVEDLTAEASSASKITLSGRAQTTAFEASSAAKIDASRLTARGNRSETSSGAKITARATETFHLGASSGSSIETFGTGRVSGKTSSGGSFKHNQ